MGKKQNILPGKIWQLSEGTKQLAYQPDQIVYVGKSVYLKDFTEREVKIKKKRTETRISILLHVRFVIGQRKSK